MKRGFSQIVVALCVLAMWVAGNSHLLFLQGAGWASMIVQFSRDSGSVTMGAQRTFSGAEPCTLCKTVLAALDQEPDETASSPPPPEFRPLMLNGTVAFHPPGVRGQSVRITDSPAPPNPTYRPPNLPS